MDDHSPQRPGRADARPACGRIPGRRHQGPSTWKARPVGEFFYENEFGTAQIFSALVGAIWQVNDKPSFDVGVRHALVGGQPVNEIRAGLTFGFPVFFGAHRQ